MNRGRNDSGIVPTRHTQGMNPTAVKWMVCSAVVPIGFYIGLSARESSEETQREKKRTEALIQRRVNELVHEEQNLQEPDPQEDHQLPKV